MECTTCGACCASFRVSFFWAAEDLQGIPDASIERLTPFTACMAGTNQASPRCIHLEGRVGEQVTCSIYPLRPSPCREVTLGDSQCRRARGILGLDVTDS